MKLAALVADFFAQIKEPELESRLRDFVTQRARRWGFCLLNMILYFANPSVEDVRRDCCLRC